jgi:hypothetical protein
MTFSRGASREKGAPRVRRDEGATQLHCDGLNSISAAIPAEIKKKEVPSRLQLFSVPLHVTPGHTLQFEG